MNECKQKGCTKQAEWIVHWPGSDVPSCHEHARAIQGIGAAMGFRPFAEKIGPQVKCATCGVACDPEDDFCYGCNNVICEECANRQTQRQSACSNNEHTLEDHKLKRVVSGIPLEPPFDIHEAKP